MFSDHKYCRVCQAALGAEGIKSVRPVSTLEKAADFGLTPLANDFCREREPHAGWYPLQVMFCPRCTLAQLSVVVDPKALYSRYNYVTSDSATMRSHFAALVNDLAEGPSLGKVLEIGSNTGDFLASLSPRASYVLGVDPAENLGKVAAGQGVLTLCDLWGSSLVPTAINLLKGKPDLIVCRHVFCHVDDWRGFVKALAEASHDQTRIAIEVPWMLDLLKQNLWDTVYHEHLSYMSVRAMEWLLQGTSLEIKRVGHYPIHGGAIVLVLGRRGGGSPVDKSVQEFLEQESGVITLAAWKEFQAATIESADALESFVVNARADNKTVCGYGASAKSSAWVNGCRFTRKELAFITDTTKSKWYCTSPGSDIPITDPGALYREQPDYAILFAWNYREEIVERERKYLEAGGKFIVPAPRLQVVSHTAAIPGCEQLAPGVVIESL